MSDYENLCIFCSTWPCSLTMNPRGSREKWVQFWLLVHHGAETMAIFLVETWSEDWFTLFSYSLAYTILHVLFPFANTVDIFDCWTTHQTLNHLDSCLMDIYPCAYIITHTHTRIYQISQTWIYVICDISRNYIYIIIYTHTYIYNMITILQYYNIA